MGDEIPTKTSDLENDSGYLTDESQTITDIQNDVDAVENSLTGVESSVSNLNTTMGELESSMTSLESSMSELDSTVSELDGLAVKYADDEKINVILNQQGHPMTLQINDATNVGDARIIFGSTNRNHISKNSLTIGVPENGETAQHMGDTHVQIGGTQNDAYVLIGQGVTLFSSKEKGKTKMFMDDDRIFVTTPATVEEGQTLKAIRVANESAMSGRSAKNAGEMTKRDEPSLRDEPQDWHWEYVSADLPSKTSDLTNDSGFVTSADVADKRDYDDLTYNDKTVRAPTYGIGKFTATTDDGQTDPIVMDTFGINDTYGSLWLKSSTLAIATQDGTNFTAYDTSFNSLATFTRTQLLVGEVSFTYDNKEWTLTAELGDGMVEKFDITINKFTWHTSHYDYDPQTKTSKWWNQQDGFFLTRSWTSSVSLSNYWQASLYRGDDGVHGNVLVASFNIGGTMGYRAGGYVPSFTYGDITQPIEWQVAGYPCQGTFGFSECIPTRNSQLVNDSQFVRQADLEDYATTDYVDENAKSAWRTWEYEPDGLMFRAEEANSTVAMQAINSAPSLSLEYSTDGTTWSDFIVGTTTVTLANVGDSVLMRAKTTNDKTGSSGSDYNTFVLTGKVAASGSILYLLDKDGGDPTSTLPERCFNNLFRQQSALTTAPKLPSLNLGPYSYSNLFFYCDSLTGCPVVQATSLDNLSLANMFNGCRSLNSIKIAYTGNFTNAFTGWVWDVSSTGTFYYNGSDTSRGGDAIPNNWTIQTF